MSFLSFVCHVLFWSANDSLAGTVHNVIENIMKSEWAEAPNTPQKCGWGSQLWGTWAQTISMASCLISTPGNSANTDSNRQTKVWSYPWNKQTKSNQIQKLHTYISVTQVVTSLFLYFGKSLTPFCMYFFHRAKTQNLLNSHALNSPKLPRAT